MKQVFLLIISIFLFTSCNSEETLFEEVSSSKSNVKFANNLTESEDFNVLKYGYFYNGGGVAAGDFNNDGLVDLYFTGNLSSNKLYINHGNFEFEDITEKAGVGAADGWNTGVSLVDINADGWLDIYVCRSAAESPMLRQNLLFINNKNLTFTNKAAEFGLNDSAYSTQASFFDYDKDGDLDVFLLNHSIQKYAGYSRMLSQYKKEENPAFSSKLMRNDNGIFTDVTKQSGLISNVLSFGLGVATSDFNNDGWLDLYVSNDYNEEDYLYINQKNGTFKESVREAMRHTSLFSMGNDAADFNNDGWIDLLTLDMQPESNERIKMTSGDDNYDKYKALITSGFHHQSMRNMLQVNNGFLKNNSTPTFAEIGQLAGVSNTDWSWAALFGDYDLDGYKDLFITNGYAKDYTNMEFLKYTVSEQTKAQETGKAPNEMEVISKMPSINEPNYVYRNVLKEADNKVFENKQTAWGLDEKMMSNGAIQADLDNDGDLDLVINNINEEAKIYKNNADKLLKNSYLTVKLVSKNPAYLIGSKVMVYQKNQSQTQEFSPVRGFQSSMYAPLTFGFDKTNTADSLVVVWANGKSETIKNVQLNKTVELKDENAKVNYVFQILQKSLFSDTYTLNFIPQQPDWNDFKVQPLLPNMVTDNSPKIAKGDVNNDGKEDFFVCGGNVQVGKLFINQNSKFIEKPNPIFENEKNFVASDAKLFDADGDSDLDLIVVSAGYHTFEYDTNIAPKLYMNDGKGNFYLSKTNIFFGPKRFHLSKVEILDYDNDEDKDLLFIGAILPQDYPHGNFSFLLKNDGKANFSYDAPNNYFSDTYINISSIQLTDINNDKFIDFIFTSLFGEVTIIQSYRGSFNSRAKHLKIANYGLWNSILAEDFDNDGDKDLILGNFGKNYQPIKNTDDKLLLYVGDFSKNNRKIPILCYQQKGKTYTFAARDELLDQIPSLKPKYNDYLKFSTATYQEISEGFDLKNIQQLSATEFETIYLENDKGNFKPKKLPVQAQYAPVFAIAAIDVNKDGYKDFVLGGNLERTRVRIGKVDANHGQVFLNDKKGNFVYGGILGIDGDVRDLKVVDNQLVVGINNKAISVIKF